MTPTLENLIEMPKVIKSKGMFLFCIASVSIKCYKTNRRIISVFLYVLLFSSRPSRRSWRAWSRSSSGRGTTQQACWPSDRLLTSSWPARWQASTPPPSVSTHSAVGPRPGPLDSNTGLEHKMPVLPVWCHFWLDWNTKHSSGIWREENRTQTWGLCASGQKYPKTTQPQTPEELHIFLGGLILFEFCPGVHMWSLLTITALECTTYAKLQAI